MRDDQPLLRRLYLRSNCASLPQRLASTMGASNVAKVFTHWTHLTHREARALLYMSNTAFDINIQHPGPPIFYGKWQDLAAAIGMTVPTDDSTVSAKKLKALASDISDLRKALVDKGALIRGPRARSGVNAEFALALDPSTGYTFSGQIRHIKWSPVVRPDPRPFAVCGSPSKGTSASPSQGTTASLSKGTTGSPSDGPPERTPGITQKYGEKEGETQAITSPAVAEYDRLRPLQEESSQEEERQRQMRQLELLIAKESAMGQVIP